MTSCPRLGRHPGQTALINHRPPKAKTKAKAKADSPRAFAHRADWQFFCKAFANGECKAGKDCPKAHVEKGEAERLIANYKELVRKDEEKKKETGSKKKNTPRGE